MSHTKTQNEIEAILREAFSPLSLEVIDDSAAHRGHKQARLHEGAGHFRVVMTSASFNGQTQIKRHRMVYEKLQHLMDAKIHALSLSLKASNE